ncbi:OmpA family protein [bacterium]|nr:OmpA family protein [bacterium]
MRRRATDLDPRRSRRPRMMLDRAAEEEESNSWLTTYSDLMTLLLVFFVLFYIFSITGQLPLLSEALKEFQGATFALAVEEEDEEKHDETLEQLEDAEVVISIPSQVLFSLGSADIKSAAVPYLEQAVDSIKAALVVHPEAEIRVEGYTDNLPIHNWRYRSNWELSAARAISVVRYLIEEHNFQPEMLQAMGYGEYFPVAANDSPANRRKNRRVELKVVKPAREWLSEEAAYQNSSGNRATETSP